MEKRPHELTAIELLKLGPLAVAEALKKDMRVFASKHRLKNSLPKVQSPRADKKKPIASIGSKPKLSAERPPRERSKSEA